MPRITFVALAGMVALSTPAAGTAQSAGTRTLEGLAFMAGCWRGGFAGGGTLEEHYTAPSSNLILGTSRFLRGGRAIQYEFSRITLDSSGIVLLPFPNGRASEHGFRLTALEADTAMFEAPEHDFPKRIRYARGSDGSLTARIDGGSGSNRVQEWRMEPAPCTQP